MFKTLKFLVKRKCWSFREKERGQQRTTAVNQGKKCSTTNLDVYRSDTVGRLQSETLTRHNERTCLRFEENILRQRVSLPFSSVKEQVINTRLVNVRSSDEGSKRWFDHQEQLFQETTPSDFHHLQSLDNHSETRIVDGLLTTTLCSTEL